MQMRNDSGESSSATTSRPTEPPHLEVVRLLAIRVSLATVIVSLQGIMGTQGQGWELLTAGAFISMLVPMLIFFSMQRFFVRGMTSGAVKG